MSAKGQEAQIHVSNKAVPPGETLLKGGAKSSKFYIIQAGRFIVNVARDGIVELHQAEAPQCLGEEILFGSPVAAATTTAVEPSSVTQVPVELAKAQLNQVDPMLGAILKGIAERIRVASNELKTIKMASGALPCPPALTANVFGTIYHAAVFVGKSENGCVEANWNEFIQFAVGVMEVSAYQIRQALNILAKLGYAEIYIEDKNLVIFKNMVQIEAFVDFYRNYYFKSSFASLLSTNDKITAITIAVLKVSNQFPSDKLGLVRMPFKPAIDALKAILGPTFEADQLFRLEQKGLSVKRVATQDGGILSFYRPEFEQMLLNWKLLREVELWNEKGYVDMKGYVSPQEREELAQEAKKNAERLAQWQPQATRGELPTIRTEDPKPGELLCPVCLSPITANQRTCEVCDCDTTKIKK